MVYNQTLTIWELPPQPLLPVNDIRDPVFVTIWLAGSFAATFYLRTLLKRNENPTWQEFGTVRHGALCLAIWYLARATDRWLRYDQRTAVKYGYALAEPMADALRIISTVLILWGTYTVVWRELEDQFSPKQQGIWWFAARFLLFIVTLTAIFYVILSIALSVVWLEFFNLNAIADIAGKRNDFEMAMTSFFLLFSLLTLAEATIAWLRAFKIHGQVQRVSQIPSLHSRDYYGPLIPQVKTRLFMWLAALFLFARSTSELAIVSDLFHFRATRQNMKFTSDISYGFITMLYFAMVCLMAKVAASTFDSGGTQAKMVASDVRYYILAMLDSQTNGGRTEPPPFETVLREVERNLDSVLSRGPLTSGLDMNSNYKEVVAMDCIAQLRNEFGRLDPRENNDDNLRPPSTVSVLTALLGRQPRQTPNFSSTTLHTNATQPRPSNASGITGSTAGLGTPSHHRSFKGTPSLYSNVSNASFSAVASPANPMPGASPPPIDNFHGFSRWAPSLGAFPEHPHQYQGVNTPEYPQPSIPIAPSPPPGPPPLAMGPAQVTRKPVTRAVTHTTPATFGSEGVVVSHPEQPLLPVVSSASTTSPAMIPDRDSSRSLSPNLSSASILVEHAVPISQSYNHDSVHSRQWGQMSLGTLAPQPVPQPPNSESNMQTGHSISVFNSLPAQLSQQEQSRSGALVGSIPPPTNAHAPQSNTQPWKPVVLSKQKDAMPFPSVAEFFQPAQVPPSSSSLPISSTPVSSKTAPPTAQAESSSSATKRKSTSPLATAGSSYRFLQAQRAFGGRPIPDILAQDSGPGTCIGYQNQPHAPSVGGGNSATTASINKPTAAAQAKPSTQKLIKNILANSGPSKHEPSRQSKASPVPRSVPKPTPPPPPRAIYSADAYDAAPAFSGEGRGGDDDSAGQHDNTRTGSNMSYDTVYYDCNPGRSAHDDELPPQTNSYATSRGGSGTGARGPGHLFHLLPGKKEPNKK